MLARRRKRPVSQSVISRSRPALTLHRLSIRLRHSRSNTSTEYSLPGATQLSPVSCEVNLESLPADRVFPVRLFARAEARWRSEDAMPMRDGPGPIICPFGFASSRSVRLYTAYTAALHAVPNGAQRGPHRLRLT